jgi:hypothetical protein
MKIGFYRLIPRLAAIAAFIGWGLTLFQQAALGGQFAGPSWFAVVGGTGLATLLTVAAEGRKLRFSGLLLWLSGGMWAGASYVSTEIIGLAYLLVAALTLGGAAVRERERGRLSLSGPAAFITAMVVMIVASNALQG